MDITVKTKKVPKSQVELTVTVSEKDMEAFKEKALLELGKNKQIKGFRPGKVPADVLKQHVQPEAIIGLALDMALNESYKEAVTKEKLELVSQPTVKLEKESPEMVYVATVAVRPEATVKDHKKISVKIKEVKVAKKDVDTAVEDLLKGKGTWSDVERKAKDGDRVEIDFQGYEGAKVAKGKEAPNTQSKNHPLILGSKAFIPGFEDNVIGMKVGESKDFTVTFPKEYHVKDFQGKKITFHVELKRLEEMTLPEYNEEFIKEATNGQKKDKKEFEAYVKEVLTKKKEDDAQGVAEKELIDKLIVATKIDVPPQLIQLEQDNLFNEEKRRIEQRGIPFEKHLELTGKTEADMKAVYAEEAENRVVMRFALDYIIEAEGFKVSKKDIEKEVANVKKMYPETEHAKINEYYADGAQGRRFLENKMLIDQVFAMYFKKK